MIYPSNFENKIQFSEIRSLLKGYCLSQLGKDKVDAMGFSDNAERINTALKQTREFRRMQEETDDFPLQFFFDMRESIKRIRIEGTHLEENEIFDLRRSLDVEPPVRDGHVRIVHIAGFDAQACGGTHVASTARIGRFTITRSENKGRANKRLYVGLADPA